MDSGTGTNYWIIVGSPENFARTAELGFTLQGIKSRHRKKAERMKPGDKIVYYITGRKAFAGIFHHRIALFREPRPHLAERRSRQGRRGLSLPGPHCAGRGPPAG